MTNKTPGSQPLKNDRRETFVQAYCDDPNATKAASIAGYKTAHTQGARLTTFVEVKERIAYVKAQRSAKRKTLRQEVIENLREIAFHGDYRPNERLKAMELLGKTEALYVEKNIHANDVPQITEEDERLWQEAVQRAGRDEAERLLNEAGFTTTAEGVVPIVAPTDATVQ